MNNPIPGIIQSVYESFYGPRTVDYDFDKKVQELKLIKEKIFQIRAIINSFPQRILPFKSMFEEISSIFGLAFDKNTKYYGFMDDVCESHRALLKAYVDCCNNMVKVSNECNDWDNKFIEVENDIKRKNELRKKYDHYDEKMEKLVKERTAKYNKGKSETESEIQRFEDNVQKYKDAALEYVQISNQAYFKIQTLLDLRYTMVAPVVGDFLEVERQFFIHGAQIMSYFDGVGPKIKKLEIGFQKTPITYDAADTLRGKSILNQAEKDGYLLKGIIPGSQNGQKNPSFITAEKNTIGNINNNINNNRNNIGGGGGYGQIGKNMNNQMNNNVNMNQKRQINNYGGIAQNPYGMPTRSVNVNPNNPYSGNPFNNNPYEGNNQMKNPFGNNNNNQFNKVNSINFQYNQQQNYNQNNNNNNVQNKGMNNNVLTSNPYDIGNTNLNENNDIQNPYDTKTPTEGNNDDLFPKPPSD